MHQGGKGYVNESRQTETTLMFINEAAERKKIYSQLPRGEFLDLKQDGDLAARGRQHGSRDDQGNRE